MSASSNTSPVILAIAGFDPSGGAGIIADIKTIVALGGTPVAAATSITMQNSESVSGMVHQTAEILRAQILPVVTEFRVAAVKIGMLPTRESVMEIVRLIEEQKLPAPVVDPVLCSTSRYELMEPAAREVLLTELMPLARVITPNIPEAETLTGLRIENEKEMREAANCLREMGARAVLIKGGHLQQGSGTRGQGSVPGTSPTVRGGSAQAIDVLDDEGRITVFRDEWINAPPVRGTGCMLSSAIAAWLAKDKDLEEAIRLGKRFVTDEIRRASELRVR